MITIISHYLQELAKIYGWEDLFSWLRIFDYVSVRAAGAALTSFGLFILFGKYIINWLKIIAPEDYISEGNRDQKGEVINNKKIGTPTMGGLMIVGFLDVSAMFWTVWNELLLLTVLSLLVLAGLGFYDDYKKVINIMTNDLNDGIGNANAEIDSRFTDELNNNLDFSSDVGIIIKEPKEFCCNNYL